MKIGLHLAILLGFSLTAFSVETWPRFRGENGAGVSDAKIPTKLGKENLLWSAKLSGPGSSSAVIWEDKLFVTSENREKKTISVICLDAKSGKANWSKDLTVGDYRLHRFHNTAAATPAVCAKSVVVSWYDAAKAVGMLSAFAHDGTKQWDFEIGTHKTTFGMNLHPVIHEDRVIICNLNLGKSYVAAISLATGKAIWKTPYPGSKTSYVTPYIHEAGAEKQIIVAAQKIGVIGLDFATGKEKWVLPGTIKDRPVSSPINVLAGSESSDALIAFGCKNGAYLTVRPSTEATKAEVVWQMKGNTPYVPTPVSNGATAFVLSDGGRLTALTAATGEKKWNEQLRANFYASPIIAGGHLYALTREGEMIVADVSKGYKEVSRTSLSPGPESQWSDATPSIAHGKIYVRLGSRIDCFGTK